MPPSFASVAVSHRWSVWSTSDARVSYDMSTDRSPRTFHGPNHDAVRRAKLRAFVRFVPRQLGQCHRTVEREKHKALCPWWARSRALSPDRRTSFNRTPRRTSVLRKLRNSPMAARIPATSRSTTGASLATGRPCLVIMNRSPFCTRSRSWGRCVLASYAPISDMACRFQKNSQSRLNRSELVVKL